MAGDVKGRLLHHVTEEELELALRDGISFHSVNSDQPEVAVLGNIAHMTTLIESGHVTTPQDRGLVLTMYDGSQFRLMVTRIKAPEFEREDQLL
jgi:hypothetical protein